MLLDPASGRWSRAKRTRVQLPNTVYIQRACISGNSLTRTLAVPCQTKAPQSQPRVPPGCHVLHASCSLTPTCGPTISRTHQHSCACCSRRPLTPVLTIDGTIDSWGFCCESRVSPIQSMSIPKVSGRCPGTHSLCVSLPTKYYCSRSGSGIVAPFCA